MFIYMCNIISFSFMEILFVKLLLLLKHANIMSIITLLYLILELYIKCHHNSKIEMVVDLEAVKHLDLIKIDWLT